MYLHNKADGRVTWGQGKPQVRLPKTSPWVSGGAHPARGSVMLHLVPVPSANPEGLGSPGSDSSDSAVLPASSWSRSGEQAHTSPKMMVCAPPRQLHEEVCMGNWNHVSRGSSSFPSHSLHTEDKHRRSYSHLPHTYSIQGYSTGGRRPKPRGQWHKKMVTKQGAQLASLGMNPSSPPWEGDPPISKALSLSTHFASA